MNNTEKKLDALIDALGFDIEETRRNIESVAKGGDGQALYTTPLFDYKLTKRTYSKNPPLHRTVRLYEKGDISAVEMIRDIMWSEGVTDKEI